MRRFSRRRQFRGSRRNDRYWVPFYLDTDSESVELDNYNTPFEVARVTPRGPLPDYAGVNNEKMYGLAQGQRLLMFQGNLEVQSLITGDVEDWEVFSRMPTRVSIWWYWIKTRGAMNYADAGGGDLASGTSSSGKFVWSNAPGTQGNMMQFLQRKDILRWGHFHLDPINKLGARYVGATNSMRGFATDPVGDVSWPRSIPFPRIPKRGFMFAPGDELKCYAMVLPWYYTTALQPGSGPWQPANITTNNGDPPGILLNVLPYYRALFAK